MRRMNRVLSAVLFALLLTGCGGGSGEGGDKLADIDAVADAAGCTTSKKEAEPMMFASATSSCTLPDGSVTINWFKNNDVRDKYVDAGSAAGASYVTGDNWAIECQAEELCAKVADATGGDTP